MKVVILDSQIGVVLCSYDYRYVFHWSIECPVIDVKGVFGLWPG